jgi:amino acid transporter
VPGEDQSRLDRELIELLNELRVTLPGVQVLFAFLLTVPFSQRFEEVTDLQKYTYLAALICAALGSAFLIAPTPYHRIRWRDRDKETLLRTANKLAIAGTAFLVVGMGCALFCVTDFLYRSPLPAFVTALFVVVAGWFWYGLPLTRELRDEGGRSG